MPPKKTKTKRTSKLVRYELWVSLDRAVVGFVYPPEGQKPVDYEDSPDDFVQIASQCWAELGGKSELDGKVRPVQFDKVEAAKFIGEKVPGSYVERVEVDA